MLDLKRLQDQFQNYLLNQDPLICNKIISTTKVPATSRLEIYREGYFLRLLEVLQNDFEGLHTLLGDHQFEELAYHYIKTHPSTFRSVRWFGKFLFQYLQNTEPYRDQPFLVEMAQFEWALTEAFDAQNSNTITIETMSGIQPDDWPYIHFKLHPSQRILTFFWNIIPLWNAVKNKGDIVAPTYSSESTDWIIWRNQLTTQFYSLSAAEAYMLNAMAANENFGAICVGLCQWIEENQVAQQAASLLKQFITDNLISEILIPF